MSYSEKCAGKIVKHQKIDGGGGGDYKLQCPGTSGGTNPALAMYMCVYVWVYV